MRLSFRDGEKKWRSDRFGGSTTRTPASEGRQFGEKPVQRHEVNSSPGKGRRISLLIFHGNTAYEDMYIAVMPPRLSWTRVDSPPSARKMFSNRRVSAQD